MVVHILIELFEYVFVLFLLFCEFDLVLFEQVEGLFAEEEMNLSEFVERWHLFEISSYSESIVLCSVGLWSLLVRGAVTGG